MGRRIRIAFETVTPESAAAGDADERGWLDEEGVEIIPEWDVDEDTSELDAVIALAVRVIGRGVEPSDWPKCQPGRTWYTEADGDTNYRTGAVTRRSFHLDGFTVAEERAIYSHLTGR